MLNCYNLLETKAKNIKIMVKTLNDLTLLIFGTLIYLGNLQVSAQNITVEPACLVNNHKSIAVLRLQEESTKNVHILESNNFAGSTVVWYAWNCFDNINKIIYKQGFVVKLPSSRFKLDTITVSIVCEELYHFECKNIIVATNNSNILYITIENMKDILVYRALLAWDKKLKRLTIVLWIKKTLTYC